MLPNKNTRTISMTSFWCLYYWLWTDFPHISGVSYVDFQYVNTAWQKSMERFGPIHSPHLVIQHENPGSRGLEAHFQDSKFKQIILLFIVLPVSLKCVPNCSILLQDHPIWTNPSSFCRLKLKNIHNFSEGWYSILKAVVFHAFRCIKIFFKKMVSNFYTAILENSFRCTYFNATEKMILSTLLLFGLTMTIYVQMSAHFLFQSVY